MDGMTRRILLIFPDTIDRRISERARARLAVEKIAVRTVFFRPGKLKEAARLAEMDWQDEDDTADGLEPIDVVCFLPDGPDDERDLRYVGRYRHVLKGFCKESATESGDGFTRGRINIFLEVIREFYRYHTLKDQASDRCNAI